MAYSRLRILDIVEDINPETRQARFKLNVEEVAPRKLTINISKAEASVINQLRGLHGTIAMVPVREGMMNGQTFLSLLPDEIIPMPDQPSSSSPRSVAISSQSAQAKA